MTMWSNKKKVHLLAFNDRPHALSTSRSSLRASLMSMCHGGAASSEGVFGRAYVLITIFGERTGRKKK